MELRAFIDFMRKRSQSGGPKTLSLDGKFYASFPSINQISGGLFQSLVHSSTISQQIKSASEQVRAFWAREANQLVVWSQMIFYHKKHQIHGEQRYLHRAMQAGSHSWTAPALCWVPVSHKHFPGTWEVSCIPQQNSFSVHSTSRHMQKIILEIHTL